MYSVTNNQFNQLRNALPDSDIVREIGTQKHKSVPCPIKNNKCPFAEPGTITFCPKVACNIVLDEGILDLYPLRYTPEDFSPTLKDL